MIVTKENKRLPKSIRNRQIKVGKWTESLKNSDVNQIWTELHRIVSSHPLVRASKSAGFLGRGRKIQCLYGFNSGIIRCAVKQRPLSALYRHGNDRFRDRSRDQPDRTDEYADG